MLHQGNRTVDRDELLRALVSLNRIVDEDLAVTHKVLHSQMFYDMATRIVGDDGWLSHRYTEVSAKEFKLWKDEKSLRDKDLMVALLTTLVHEIYTHGEVEFIHPLFRQWLGECYGFTVSETRRALGWIAVHCGGTEKNHFFHALDATESFAAACSLSVEDYEVHDIVGSYLEKKSAVLDAVSGAITREVTHDSDLQLAAHQ